MVLVVAMKFGRLCRIVVLLDLSTTLRLSDSREFNEIFPRCTPGTNGGDEEKRKKLLLHCIASCRGKLFRKTQWLDSIPIFNVNEGTLVVR